MSSDEAAAMQVVLIILTTVSALQFLHWKE